ncbi:hypothetical protein AXG93_4605s1040 [Marchantia polymorpha subsp. ruderalis]|nr:hypothetical protein AXG93_4605s1040 [Marchantia polymorpha subsp. ruderalis]
MADTLSDFIAAFFNQKQHDPMEVVLGCNKRFEKIEQEDEEALTFESHSSERYSDDGAIVEMPIRNLQQSFTESRGETKRFNRSEMRKMSEMQLVEHLREWKRIPNKKRALIGEADVYETHPEVLMKGSSSSYFITSTRYTLSQRPRRLRKTENGCRWRQQGRSYPINDNGIPVAYKTYLSYVPLKDTLNRQTLSTLGYEAPDINFFVTKDESNDDSLLRAHKKKEVRKWAIWTMEEIVLAEDLDLEKVLLQNNQKPDPVPMICRILCKRDSRSSRRSSVDHESVNSNSSSSLKVKTEEEYSVYFQA